MKHQHMSTNKARAWVKVGLIAARVKPWAGFAAGLMTIMCVALWFGEWGVAAIETFRGHTVSLGEVFAATITQYSTVFYVAGTAAVVYYLATGFALLGSTCSPTDSKQFVDLIEAIDSYGDLRALVRDWTAEDGPDGVQVRDYKAIMAEVARRNAKANALTRQLREQAAKDLSAEAKRNALAKIL